MDYSYENPEEALSADLILELRSELNRIQNAERCRQRFVDREHQLRLREQVRQLDASRERRRYGLMPLEVELFGLVPGERINWLKEGF